MEWFIAVVVVAALGAAALVAAGGLGQMAKDPVRDVYRQDLPPVDQPLQAADISGLRFGVTLRGYAMAQVDDVLDRLAREIAERDAVIAELTGRRDGGATDVAGSQPDQPEADPAQADAPHSRGAQPR